jgi:hypothetical protein
MQGQLLQMTMLWLINLRHIRNYGSKQKHMLNEYVGVNFALIKMQVFLRVKLRYLGWSEPSISIGRNIL